MISGEFRLNYRTNSTYSDNKCAKVQKQCRFRSDAREHGRVVETYKVKM